MMRVLLILISCLAACAGAAGQDSQIFGLIRDPSSASVDGAEIVLRNEQTGGVRNTKSNESGSYSLPALQPGGYRLTVRGAGFQTIVREGIQLNVGENARIDFALSIGSAQTTITVHDDHPIINTTDASVGTVVNRTLIDQLPSSGGQIQTLVELSPGVTVVPVSDSSRGQFVINGQRSDANYLTVDGVSANFAVANSRVLDFVHIEATQTAGQAGGGMLPANNFLGTFSNLLSPEALEEFKIQTSTYAPEFGHLPGGQIGLISRSGSMRYSGSVYGYFRNSATDANDWFNTAQGIPRLGLHFDNFGGTFGGPLRLPRRSHGKDRTFFFLSVDLMAIHQSQPAPTIPVPTLSARQNAPPELAAVLNAFPLPSGQIDPNGNASTPGFAQFTGASPLMYDQSTYALRVDHNFGDKLSLFVRFNHAPSERIEPFVEPGTPSNIQRYRIETDSITAGLTQSISSSTVNEIRLNFSRQSASDIADIDRAFGAIRPEIAQFLPAGYSGANSFVLLAIDKVGGASVLFLGTFSKNQARQMEFLDNLSLGVGTHLLKLGVDYRRFSPINSTYSYSPAFSFDGIYTHPGSYISTISSIETFADSSPRTAYVVPTFGAFAQDTWRMTRRFTVTYGLRWEVDPAPRVSEGRALAAGGLTNLNDTSNVYPLPSGRPFYPTTYGNIAPRVGTAWRMLNRGKWTSVLRAGAGVFFSSAQGGFEDTPRNPMVLTAFTNQPFGSIGTGTPAEVLDLPLGISGVAVAAAPRYRLPVVYQWNVMIEQAVGRQTFSVGYVGSVGRRLIGSIPLLPSLSSFPALSVLGNNASSSYNALQLQFNRRLAHRLQILTSYTFSHSIDNSSEEILPGTLVISRTLSQYLHPDVDRGSSNYDIRHTLNGAVIAELPAPHGGVAGIFLRNWSASGIFFARSALPTDILDPLNMSLRPNIVPGQPLYLYGPQYPGGKSYNFAAFAHSVQGVEGNFGRNVLRGFGAWQLDFAMHRRFELSEKASLEFRAEAFNILNHPNFANPATDPDLEGTTGVSDPGVLALTQNPKWGQSTAMLANGLSPSSIPGELTPLFQIGGPRVLQFGLRLCF